MKKCNFCGEVEATHVLKSRYTQRSGKYTREKYASCLSCVEEFVERHGKDERFKITYSDFKGMKDCKRCGGSGHVPIPYAQGVCFGCNGTGKSSFIKERNKK